MATKLTAKGILEKLLEDLNYYQAMIREGVIAQDTKKKEKFKILEIELEISIRGILENSEYSLTEVWSDDTKRFAIIPTEGGVFIN